MRATIAPEMLRQSQARHPGSGMKAEQWKEFLLDYKGPVDKSLADYKSWVDQKIAELEGSPPPANSEDSPHIADDENLEEVKLATLEAEIARIEGLLNADKLVRNQYSALSRRIAREEAALRTLQSRLDDANGAAERRRVLQQERNTAYERVFDAIVSEQRALVELYGPIQERLEAGGGTLKKLRFSISRVADAVTWPALAPNGSARTPTDYLNPLMSYLDTKFQISALVLAPL